MSGSTTEPSAQASSLTPQRSQVSMVPRLLFAAVLCITARSVFSQAGTDCKTDPDCNPHQSCSFGYCQCHIGFIKNIHHCFPILQYGEVCHFIAQCQDFRMVCESQGESMGHDIKRCVCDRYHEWNPELEVCVQASNLTEMVRALEEEITWAEDIQREGRKVFFGLVVAGLSVVGVGLVFAALCMVYGCCCRGKRPAANDDTEKLGVHEVASMDSPRGTYVPIPTDLTGGAGSSGAAIMMPIG